MYLNLYSYIAITFNYECIECTFRFIYQIVVSCSVIIYISFNCISSILNLFVFALFNFT